MALQVDELWRAEVRKRIRTLIGAARLAWRDSRRDEKHHRMILLHEQFLRGQASAYLAAARILKGVLR